MAKIREVNLKKDDDGNYQEIKVLFGPHHGLKIWQQEDRVKFKLVFTHHGFEADASEVPSELENLMIEVMNAHPKNTTDNF